MRQESERLKEEYKNRLKKIVGKKFDTTMIFSLSQFETAFGHMWGHGLESTRLTDEQKVMRDKWKQCRENILNNGNQQKRNAKTELDMHEVIWKKYQTILVPVTQEDKGE